MTDTDTDTTDYEEIMTRDPLIQLFGDNARSRIVAVLVDAEQPLNPTAITHRAAISRETFYRHRDELEDTGLLVKVGHAGNSPLFAVPDADDDLRTEWLEELRDWTQSYRFDGTRPTRDSA